MRTTRRTLEPGCKPITHKLNSFNSMEVGSHAAMMNCEAELW